jgi:hypothetical protein
MFEVAKGGVKDAFSLADPFAVLDFRPETERSKHQSRPRCGGARYQQ